MSELRIEFNELLKRNNETEVHARLSKEELCLDPEYIEQLNQRVEDDLDDTRKELKWDQEFF